MTKRDKIGFVFFIVVLLIVVFTFEAFSQTPSDTVLVGRNSQRSNLGNGRGKLEIGGGVINFQNSNGVWKREDNSIKIYADTTSFGNTMVVKDSRLWVEFPDSSNGFVIVGRREPNNLNSIVKQKFKGAAFYNRQTKEYQFIAPSIVAATDILLGENVILYENVYNGADLKYSKTDRHLKEELILNSVLRGSLTDPYPGDETWIVLVSEIDYGVLSFENDEHSENVFGASFREDSTSYSIKRSGNVRINIPLQSAYLAEDPETTYNMKTFSKKVNGKNLMLSGIPFSLVSDTLNYPGELVFDPTFETQPNASDGKDNMLKGRFVSTQGLNWGVGQMDIESQDRIHALIHFDSLTTIVPSYATVLSAELNLIAISTGTNGGNDTIRVYPLTHDWTEGTGNGVAGVSNWDSSSASGPWITAGGDWDSSSTSNPYVWVSGASPIAAGDTLAIDVTPLVQATVDSTSPDFGWVIRFIGSTTALFHGSSSDDPTATDRPKLTVFYIIPFELVNTNIDSIYTNFTIQVDTTLNGSTPPDSFVILNSADSSFISDWFPISSEGSSVSTHDTLTSNIQYLYLTMAYSSDDTVYSSINTISTLPYPPAYDLVFSNITDIGATASWDTSDAEFGAFPDSFQIVGQDSTTLYSEFTTDITVPLVDTLTFGTTYSMRVKSLLSHPHILELQPDGTIGQDSWLDSNNPTVNHGNDVTFQVHSSSGDAHRGITRFTQLSDSLESQSTSRIVSAFVQYTLASIHSATLDSMVNIREIIEVWDEDQTTWINRLTGTAWAAAGGWDGFSSAYGERNLNGKIVGDTVLFDITELVKKWVGEDSSIVNNGFVVTYASEGTPPQPRDFTFESSNSVTPANRPKLIVNYLHFDSSFSDTTSFETVSEPSITSFTIPEKDHKSFTVSFDTVLFSQVPFDSFAVLLSSDSSLISDFYTTFSFRTDSTLLDSTSYTIMIGGFNDDTLRTISSSLTEFTNHLILGNAAYDLGVVSRFYNGAILTATDSSGAGTNRAIFNEVNGLFTADTIALTAVNPETFLDTVYFTGLYDSLINVFVTVIDVDDTTYISPDTLSFYSMSQQVTTLNVIATTETTATFVFGPDSNANDILYRVTDSSTSFTVFVDTLSDTSSTDSSWYIKTAFDTLTVNSAINELHRIFVEALNSDSLSNGLTLSDSVWTWAVAPAIDTVYVVNKDSIILFVDPGDNPSYTYFAFEDSISGLFVDVGTMSFRSSSITVDSSWAWGTYADWGGVSGAIINTDPNTRYVLRGYSKDGNKKDQD